VIRDRVVVSDAGATSREASLRDALETEKGRATALAEENRRMDRELSAARQDASQQLASTQSGSAALESELREARAQASGAERRREVAESAANDAKARAAAAESEKAALAAQQSSQTAASEANAERRAADADRRAADADARAAAADEKMEKMKRLARTTPGGADAATLHNWQAEADAAAAGSPSKGRGAGAAPDASNPKSPTKRRREKSPEVDNFVDAEEEQAVEEEGVETRAAAEAMTVQQLRHDLQVRGLAHLYLNKKSVKKADLVGMFLAP